MKAERIIPVPLDKKKAKKYALFVAEEQLKRRAVKVRSLGGGSFGRAYAVTFADGGSIVVKMLRAKGMCEKETHDLGLLGRHCPVKMPAVLFVREADAAVPVDCYGMEKIGGKTAMFALGMLLQSKKKRLAFADKVTGALHAIHECKNDRFGDTMDPACTDWLACYKPFARDVLDKAEALHAAGQLPAKIVKAMRAAWAKFDVIFSEKVEEACLIHGDLNINNIMVGKKYAITGFIDPLNSMYADREYDLFQFNNLTGKKFFLCETYKRKYGASRRCDQKLAFYGLWNEVFCYIRAGVLVGFIMNPLVKNMYRTLEAL